MFKKVLIANRGEIACRIIRTCKRLGIKTVAVYSEVDKKARHVALADESIYIGPASAKESYLNSQALIDAAYQTQAEAIHPGYGFLSEKADFAELVLEKKLAFIGPSPSIIRLMGDKIKAKAIAQKLDLPLIPGIHKALTSLEEVKDFIKEYGFPILLKAAAGGGGKGMRLIEDLSSLQESFDIAQNEAFSSFKDSRLFVEKYISYSRHVEVQILGDSFGHLIHLGERECSLQRRHQKIIEETPSPSLTNEQREEMIAYAIKLGKEVGYNSAGTVEFIVDEKGKSYFLEMNTRLQVEHPVTEMVTGLDLVEEMIHLAGGEKLRYTQADISFKGCAIEARLCAEDQEFIPSTGKLTYYRFSSFVPDYRFETGVEEGDEITPYYDPMIAKIIVHASHRHEAIHKLDRVLQGLWCEGITCNKDFLSQLLNTPEVLYGNFSTHFVEKEFRYKTFKDLEEKEQKKIAYFAICYHQRQQKTFYPEWVFLSENITFTFSSENCLSFDFSKPFIQIEGELLFITCLKTRFSYLIGYKGIVTKCKIIPSSFYKYLTYFKEDSISYESNIIKAPMPGVLGQIVVAKGEKVQKGQIVAIIEAMKMENAIKAPLDAIVQEIYFEVGNFISKDEPIMRLLAD